MKYAILGAGMSGLVMAEILTLKGVNQDDIHIFSKDILGQQKYDFNLGPRILHRTKKVQEFLGELYENGGFATGGAPSPYKKFKIGYIDKNENLVERTENTIKQYARNCGKALEISTMSGGKTEIDGFDIRMLGLPRVLKAKFIRNIIQYELDWDCIEEILKDYDKVYCTLPYIELLKMRGIKSNSIIGSELFVLTTKNFKWSDYDYVYDLSDRPIKRITRSQNNKCIYEFIMIDKVYAYNLLGLAIDKIVVKNVSILNSEPITDYQGMEMVGRFAENNHNVRLDTIIERYL